jgi:hypothetical protein
MITELRRTISDNIYLEKEVEKIKIELSLKQDFTSHEAFHLFD